MTTAVFAPLKEKKKNHLCELVMQIISWKVLQNTESIGYSDLCRNSLLAQYPGMGSSGC